MGWLELIGMIAGSAAGEAASGMQQAEVMRLIKSVSDEYGKIDVPQLQKLLLEKMPESKLNGLRDDPGYRSQQNAADAQLDDVINSGGLTLADRGALNAIRGKVSRTESAGRNAITNGMAARGSLDSGAQLAAQLQGNQQATQAAAEAGEHTAGAAQARAFEAIRARAANAGAGLDRTYRQESDKARAADAINAGNAQIANTAARYNTSIPQQNFDNQMRKVGAGANATYALAGANAAQAKDTKQAYQGIGNAAGAAAQSGYDAYKSNNTASGAAPAAAGGGFANEQGGQDWGSDPNSLTGEPTKQRQIIGYRTDGRPIYAEELR